MDAIRNAIAKAGFRLNEGAAAINSKESHESVRPRYMEIGAALIIIFAIYQLLQAFDLASLAPSTAGSLTVGGIFLIGIVAGSSSCLAVTGGLLLAMAAKYNQIHGGADTTTRLKPLIQFNVGRLVSYAVLGGVIGLIGTAITLPIWATAYLNIFVALVMLYLALTILGIIPKGAFPIRPPKALSHRIADLTKRDHPLAPIALGALTFFLPCGFTQSLQLAALASGGFVPGAVIMGVFAIVTLPALLGISFISSTAKGSFSRIFLTFAGTLVFVLALFNLRSGLALAGFDYSSKDLPTADQRPPTTDAEGIQEVRMKVTAYGYEPDELTIRSGSPVRFIIDGTQAGGCTQGFVIPSLGIQKILEAGDNIIEFTPAKPGRIAFSCSMGMVRGAFNVL
jgi:sulfite exporter TauE/SafE